MALKCNIDSKGRAARLVYGVIVLVAGVISAILWARPAGTALAWAVSAALVASGTFAIFEARAGWCVVRAMV